MYIIFHQLTFTVTKLERNRGVQDIGKVWECIVLV
jgi:hypothetical protein